MYNIIVYCRLDCMVCAEICMCLLMGDWQLYFTWCTVEPLNKGHLCTEGIVPYSEVVPYWEVSQKS